MGEKHLEFATEGVKQSTRASYVEVRGKRTQPQDGSAPTSPTSPRNAGSEWIAEGKDKIQAQRAVDVFRRLSVSDILAKRAREQRHLPPKTLRFKNMVKFSGDFAAGGVVLDKDVDLVTARLAEVK